MPELPEVETVVRGLRAAALTGRRVTGCRVRWPKTVEGVTPEVFRRRMTGRRVLAIGRRGKYIVLTLDEGWTLLIHLRMTGRLQFAPRGAPLTPHEHVALALDDGRELRFADSRKFGRWTLTRTPEDRLAPLGPEPLARSFTAVCLRTALAGRRGRLKPTLLDQTVVAGLGNIYVDEALWEAGLHPRAPVDALGPEAVQALHTAIRTVLRRGVDAMGTTLGSGATNFYSVAGRRGRNQDGLRVFRRTGEACPRCGAPIRRIVVGQRGTHLCPVCQPPPGGA